MGNYKKPDPASDYSFYGILGSKEGFSECEGCPLYMKSVRVPGHIPEEGADVIFIGESPGSYEREEPFTGPAGQLLRELLEEAGLSSFALTNRCHCRSYDAEGKDCPPPEQAIKQCSRQLQEDVEQSRARMVVALGATAMKVVPDWEKEKITRIRGTVTTHPTFKKPLMPIIHPAAPLHSGSALQLAAIRTDLLSLKYMLKGVRADPTKLIKVEIIDTKAKMEKLIQSVSEVPHVTYDIETPGGRPEGLDYTHPDVEILCYGVSLGPLGACVVPVYHPELGRSKLEHRWWIRATKRLLDAAKVIIAHNTKFDLNYTRAVFKKYLGEDWEVGPERLHDTMALHYCMHHPSLHGLKAIGRAMGFSDWDASTKRDLLAEKVHRRMAAAELKQNIRGVQKELKKALKLQEKAKTLVEDLEDDEPDAETDDAITWQVASGVVVAELETVVVEMERMLEGLETADGVSWYDLKLDALVKYNGIDAAVTWLVYDNLCHEATRTVFGAMSFQFYQERMREMVCTFAEAEVTGVAISRKAWEEANDFFIKFLARRYLEILQLPPIMRDVLQMHGAELATFQSLAARALDEEYMPNKKLFNPLSIVQLRRVLFERGGLERYSHLKKTGYSCDSEALGNMKMHFVETVQQQGVHGIAIEGSGRGAMMKTPAHHAYHYLAPHVTEGAEVREALDCLTGYAVMRYRQAAKLHSSYIKPVPGRLAGDGLYHPDLLLTRTATGRLASWLHTIPYDKRLKKMIVSRYGPRAERREFRTSKPGYIVGGDLSQIEVRLMAVFADRLWQQTKRRPGKLASIYASGADMHTYVASIMLGIPEDEVTGGQRRRCKGFHFGLLYLESAEAMAKGLWSPDMGMSMEELTDDVQRRLNNYFRGFPEVKAHMKRVARDFQRSRVVHPLIDQQEDAEENYRGERGYFVLSPYGRVMRSAPDTTPWDLKVIPVNWPIQSTGSDITSFAALRMARALKDQGFAARLFGTIHDALYVDSPPDEVRDVVRLMYDIMEDTSEIEDWFSVPLVAEVGIGTSMASSDVVDRDMNVLEVKEGGARYDRYGIAIEI